MQPANDFQSHLRELFPARGYAMPIEVVSPYKGKLGSHTAEIYSPNNIGIDQMISKIAELKLSTKFFEEEKSADVILSNCGMRGGTVQLVFTNDKAFNLFRDSLLQIESNKSKLESILKRIESMAF